MRRLCPAGHSPLLLTTTLSVMLAAAASAATADTAVAVRPGLMCTQADALARLTLPDGSNRAESAHARQGDADAQRQGGCIDIPRSATVSILSKRHNTSVVSFDPHDGLGSRTFYVPNIDFRFTSGTAQPPAPATDVWGLVHARCPAQDGWRVATPGDLEYMFDTFAPRLSAAEASSLKDQIAQNCPDVFGLRCSNSLFVLGFEEHGRASELAEAICRADPPPR